jgi:hypothetical protein
MYTYNFTNTGTVPLNITEAMSKVTGTDPTDLIDLIQPTTLQPGETTIVGEFVTINYCQENQITTTVTAKAIPGPCEAEETYIFTPILGRRSLRQPVQSSPSMATVLSSTVVVRVGTSH